MKDIIRTKIDNCIYEHSLDNGEMPNVLFLDCISHGYLKREASLIYGNDLSNGKYKGMEIFVVYEPQRSTTREVIFVGGIKKKIALINDLELVDNR
jgi:hypothetical protein